MNRRQILQIPGHWLTAGAAGLVFAGCSREKPPAVTDPASLLETDSPLENLRTALQAGRISSASAVQWMLRRIEAVDRTGPAVNAILELHPDALTAAQRMDMLRTIAKPIQSLPFLHGIPVLLKDNIATADGMETTAGSLALLGAKPAEDALLVQWLRASGLIIFGKTNLSEWANFRSPQSTSGWSGRGGQTKNPHCLSRNPSGSSSGSAAAVAAGLAPAAVGTETDGSIVSPAGVCGIIGLKPTVGLISRRGIIPISRSQDTAGPMARSVMDAARLLQALICPEPASDPGALAPPWTNPPDYSALLHPDALRGKRLGVARSWFAGNRRVQVVMDAALSVLRGAGAELVDPVSVPSPEEIGKHEMTVLFYEFKHGLNAWLQALPVSPVRTLQELIAWNIAHADRELAHFGQEYLITAAACGGLEDSVYLEALAACRELAVTRGLDPVFTKQKCDAIIAVTNAPAWRTTLGEGDAYELGCSTLPAVGGYPHLTVPAGRAGGLPVGLSFIGPHWSEPELLALGYAFEQKTHAFQPPEFIAEA